MKKNSFSGQFDTTETATASNEHKYKYVIMKVNLIERDAQIAFIMKYYPVVMVLPGKDKSIRLILLVNANDKAEYDRRVHILYDSLSSQGLKVNKNYKNPSFLKRIPKAIQNKTSVDGGLCNVGWDEWYASVLFDESLLFDGLPKPLNLSDFSGVVVKPENEIIKGVLRKGHKAILAGPSKAGKSFLLMELCVAIAEGTTWLGFPCSRGKVLYINLEIDNKSCIIRFQEIYKALGLPINGDGNIMVWPLRGKAKPLSELSESIIQASIDYQPDVVIIDPIYKIIAGDENSATDMGKFCNEIDRITKALGCSVIICHHHSKGTQGQKKSIDRSSGSSVFARDPDAILDIIELEADTAITDRIGPDATAWRLEMTLREFKDPAPVKFWFDYPVHRVDHDGLLSDACARGEPAKRKTIYERNEETISTFDKIGKEKVPLSDFAREIGVCEKTARERIRSCAGLTYDNGYVSKVNT